MPTVTLKKDVLEKMMGKKLPIEKLKDRISMIGTDLEKIEGNEIVVEVFPNRPDMLSEAGFARAISAFIGEKPGLRNYKVNKANPKDNYKVIIDSSVADVRPFTSCAIIKGLKLDDNKLREIINLQEKLHITFARNRKKLAIGIYPLDKIQMPITYKALNPDSIKFRPLESEKEMTGKQILEQHPTGKTYGHLLEGKKKFPIFIDAKGNILSMPPIINSYETGRVLESTKDVFIECSGFDQEVLDQCISIIVSSLADMGGQIYEMTLESGKTKKTSPNLSPKEWKVDLNYLRKMIGLDLKENDVKNLLAKMGIGYSSGKSLVPFYRVDILHQIDIAEDIAIAYGYENFIPEIPNVMTTGEEDKLEVFKNRLANILIGMGLLETTSYNLSNIGLNSLNPKSDTTKIDDCIVELENSKTIDRTILRSWLLPSLMQILSQNTNKEYPQELFEIGTTFKLDKDRESGVRETPKVSIAIAGADNDFTSIKQISEELSKALDKKFSYNKIDDKSFSFLINGRSAIITLNDLQIGFLGEIHPQILENFGIQMPVATLELDIGKIYELLIKK